MFALGQGKPLDAIKLLEAALPNEPGVPALNFQCLLWRSLFGLRARRSVSEVHQSAEAAVEFQKILDHRGLTGGDPVSALAYLQLGRAYFLSGDETKAKTAYQDFLTVWKDADRDIPVLQQAKAERARLQ